MKHLRKKSFDIVSIYDGYSPSVGGIFILLGLLLAGALAGNFVTLAICKFLGGEFAATYGMLISYPVQFIPPMLYASSKGRMNLNFEQADPIDSRRFAPIGGAMLVLMAAVVTICCAIVTEPVTMVLPEMPARLKMIMEQLAKGPLWVSLLTTAVFAPFFEEWLCRGMVMRGLLKKVRPVWAVIFSAAFFALIHLNPWQAIPAFVLGCLFGLVYYKTGSLKLTMLMHCVNNGVSVLLGHTDRFGEADSFWQAFPDKTVYFIIYTLCLALTILFTVRLLKTEFTEKSE